MTTSQRAVEAREIAETVRGNVLAMVKQEIEGAGRRSGMSKNGLDRIFYHDRALSFVLLRDEIARMTVAELLTAPPAEER